MLGFMSFSVAIVFLPALVIGITVHEFAHAWSAGLLGDNFPRRQGRVSLNPFRHLTPLGTLAIFLLPFGWGRPVMVNLYNFRHPKRDYLLSSLAGPAANLVVCALCIGLMPLAARTYLYGPGAASAMDLAYKGLRVLAIINAVLAAVNLVPIPPLDGSKIWPCLVPGLKPTYGVKNTWLFIIVLIVLLRSNVLSAIIEVPIGAVVGLMPVSDAELFSVRMKQADDAINKSRDFAAAEWFCDQAIALNPQSASAHYKRALARGSVSNWQGALEDMDRAISISPSARFYEYRATVNERLGRDKQAAEDLVTAESLRKTAHPAGK